jgi:hypothetical protein
MKYPGAQWRPLTVNFNRGGNKPKLFIVHIMQGSLAGTDSWFHNPAAQVSAHFGVGKDGTIYQWVNTSDTAWHAANANRVSIGCECEGFAGHPLTAAQVNAVSKLYAWAHKAHEIPLWLAKRPEGSGLAWHGLGGASWGGHTGCPGAPVVAQLPDIERNAKVLSVPADPPPKPGSYVTAGMLSLAGLADKLGMTPATILRMTVQKYGPLDGPLAKYVNRVFRGEAESTEPLPAGLRLWVMK